jgi:hypothetical protein
MKNGVFCADGHFHCVNYGFCLKEGWHCRHKEKFLIDIFAKKGVDLKEKEHD